MIEIFKKGKVSDGTYRKYLYTLSVLKKHFSTATIKTMNRVKYQEMLNEFAEGHSDSSVKQIGSVAIVCGVGTYYYIMRNED